MTPTAEGMKNSRNSANNILDPNSTQSIETMLHWSRKYKIIMPRMLPERGKWKKLAKMPDAREIPHRRAICPAAFITVYKYLTPLLVVE